MRSRMPVSSASEGRSTHCPVTSYFQPWYGQRSPHSSLRPNHSDTPRWAQNSSISPRRPSRIAEGDQPLAEELHANGRAIPLGQLPVEQRGYPVAPEELAHRRAGAGAGQQLFISS